MKVSYNWLKDYLKCDLNPEEIAAALTSIGLEVDAVEEVEQIPGGLVGVIVAEVVECHDHPDSDHLHVTRLNTGTGELLQVVCGALRGAECGCRTESAPGYHRHCPGGELQDKEIEDKGSGVVRHDMRGRRTRNRELS